MPRNTALQYRKEQAYREAFEEMMTKGAEEFGGLWLGSHNAVTQIISKLGVDYTTPEIKAVMAATVLHTLYKARGYYRPATRQPTDPPALS